MKTAIAAVLLALCLPAVAGAPKDKHKTPAVPVTVADALNQVTGKNQIVGITETSGTRFLGRVLSGDSGLYILQTFHFAGQPLVTTQQTTWTTGSGRKRRTQHGTTRIYTDTTIPDDQAVRLLLSGVAGASTPRELAGGRVMLSPTDVKFVQTLTPPISPKLSKLSTGQPVIVSPTAAKQLGWTMASLWPPAKTEVSALAVPKP